MSVSSVATPCAKRGVFWIGLAVSPFIFSAVKECYNTQAQRKVRTQEILSKRIEWLRKEFIRDEVVESLIESRSTQTKNLILGPQH